MAKYLNNIEKEKARKLYESIFLEDSEKYVDFYFENVVSSNEIIADIESLKEPGEIVSMIHLNPYWQNFFGKKFLMSYIVAVATKPEYRSQGRMGRLLKKSLTDMNEKGTILTYLMPINRKIYEPYDFRYIYEAEERNVNCYAKSVFHAAEASEIKIIPVDESMLEAVCLFANTLLAEEYDMYTLRTPEYYKVRIKEAATENGRLMAAVCDGEICGVYIEFKTDHIFLMDFIINKKYERKIIEEYKKMGNSYVKIQGINNKSALNAVKPMIMARVVSVYHFFENYDYKRDFQMKIKIYDPIIEANNHVYVIEAKSGINTVSVADDAAAYDMELNIGDIFKYFPVKGFINELV